MAFPGFARELGDFVVFTLGAEVAFLFEGAGDEVSPFYDFPGSGDVGGSGGDGGHVRVVDMNLLVGVGLVTFGVEALVVSFA